MLRPVTAPPRPARAVLGALIVLAVDAALLAAGLGGLRALAHEPRAWALLAAWAAGGLVTAARRPARPPDVALSKPDPLTMVVLLLVPLLTPMLGAFAARRGWVMLPAAGVVSWIGVALAAAGLALRVASILRLGARFSPLVAVQHEHALETAGPYAWVRHPGYSGALIACLGGAVAFGSAAVLPLVALMLVAELARIRAEERVLASHFGEAWNAYAARTGALVPFLGRARRGAAPAAPPA